MSGRHNYISSDKTRLSWNIIEDNITLFINYQFKMMEIITHMNKVSLCTIRVLTRRMSPYFGIIKVSLKVSVLLLTDLSQLSHQLGYLGQRNELFLTIQKKQCPSD